MTNEEIRKRFKFDLEMGVFDKKYDERFILFKNNDSNGLRKLLEILKSFDCVKSILYREECINENSIAVIAIYDTKIFYGISNSLHDSFYPFIIELPDYINDYQL